MNSKNTDIRTFDIKIRAETGLSNENSNNQAENGQNMAISGVATVFNQPSVKGDFTEFIDQNALNDVDLSQVLLLYSHDFSNILARADSGTLSTSIQSDGLHFNATLPDTTLGHDTYTNVQNGNIRGMSFGFTISPGGDSWSVDSDGNTIHLINQIDQVFELSLTPIPAYSETSVQVQRDLAQFLEQKKEVETMAEKPDEKEEQKRSIAELQQQLADLKSKINTQVVIDQPTDKKEEKRDAAPEAPDATPAAPADADGNEQPTSGDLVSMIATLQQAIQSLSQQLAAQQAPTQTDNDDSDDGSDVVLDQNKPAEVQRDAKPTEQHEENGDGNKNMAKNLTQDKVEDEQVRDFKEFLRTGEIKRDSAGFDSNAGAAIIPTQILDLTKQPADSTQLSSLVNKVAVSAPVGKLPIMARASAQLATATELAQNPEIANAVISPVNYDVKTYRGQLPISMEMSQDYPQITSLLASYVNDVTNQTEQHEIGKVLQTAQAVSASSVDDLKDAFNVGLTNYTDKVWVLSESMFAALDKIKDLNGRYLLEDSISAPTGKTFLGTTLYVVSDDVLGSAGDAKAFVGSVHSFVLEAIRSDVTIQWVRNEQFENILGVAVRADFEPADTAAGKFVTYKAASTASTTTSGK